MKQGLFFLFLMGCVTNPGDRQPSKKDNIVQIGELDKKLAVGSTVELGDADWRKVKATCVTHIYRCEIDPSGKVSAVKALDLSSPDFQEYTEEALLSWQFESGRPGSCFVQYAYERGQATRILILPESLALEMADNLAKNRADLPAMQNKPFPKRIAQRKPNMPRDAALRGIEGFAVYHFKIDDEGIPRDPVLLRSYPEGVFEKAALDAIRGWRYASLKDDPHSQRHSTVTIEFHLVGQNHVSSCDFGFQRNKLAAGRSAPKS